MMAIAIVVLVLLILLVVGVLMARKKKGRRPAANAEVFRELLNVPGGKKKAAGEGGAEVERLRQNLRVKLLYQEDKVEEAVAFERERNPGGNSEGWLKAAVERWERDNR